MSELLKALQSQGGEKPKHSRELLAAISGPNEAPEVKAAESATSRLGTAFDVANNIAADMNKAIIGTLDLPAVVVDLVSASLGSEYRMGKFVDLPGIRRTTTGPELEQDVEDYVRPIRTGLSFAAGGLTPGGLASGFAGKSTALSKAGLPQATKTVSPTIKESITDPRFLAEEAKTSALFGAGAGTASAVAGEESPMLEVLGGMVAATRGSFAKAAVNSAKMGYETGKQIFSKTTQSDKAVEIILKHATNPEQALKNIKEGILKGKEGSLAQLAKDDGIFIAEKALGSKYSFLGKGLKDKDVDLTESVLSRIESIGDDVEGATAKFFNTKLAAKQAQVDAEINQAVNKARFAKESIETPLYPGDSSKVLDEELNTIIDNLKVEERAAWSEVGDFSFQTKSMARNPATGDFEPGLSWYDEFKQTLDIHFGSDVAKDDAVKALSEHLTRIKDWSKKGEVPVRELIDLRSLALDSHRALKKDGATRFANQGYNKLQEFLVGKIQNAGETGVAYQEAASFTRMFHEKFSDGVLSLARDHKIIPEQLGDKLFISGSKGIGNADEILGLAGNKGVVDATENFILSKFEQSVIRNGEVNPQAANAFLRKHGDFLSRFPGVKQKLQKAVTSQDNVQATTKRLDAMTKSDLEKARMEAFIGFEDSSQAINALIGGTVKDRRASAKLLVDMASKDATGEALSGLKRASAEALIGRVTTQLGQQRVIKSTFDKEFKRIRPALEEIFSKSELSRVKAVLEEADNLFKRSRAPNVKIDPEADMIMATAGRILGARIGARIGVTPLISAGIGGRLVQRVASSLPHEKAVLIMEEMILDPKKFMESAKRVKQVKTMEQAVEVIDGWLIAATGKAGESAEQQEYDRQKRHRERAERLKNLSPL